MSGQTSCSGSHRKADNASYHYVKRALDVTIAVMTLIGLFPFLVLIGILIKIDSRGPIFFVQTRVGATRCVKNGQVYWEPTEFSICKFRTMVNNADQGLHKEQVKAFAEGRLSKTEEGWVKAKIQDDPRVTRFGHLLRKTSLDEIPQIINIIRGEMSIVGPRPVPPYEAALHTEEHQLRLTVLPGMTGLWQIEGRGRSGFDEMMALDIRYAQSCCLWLDLKIILLTIPAAFSSLGAS